MTASILSLSPQHWTDYELLDTGEFEKLERFGPYIMTRPEPQAIWDRSLPVEEWDKRSNAIFRKDPKNPEKGNWTVKGKMPHNWQIGYQKDGMNLKLNLAMSSFKHVGLFPEQACNWDYIYERIQAMPVQKPKVLNLFAYTGAASIAARAAGAEVTHLDAVKQVVTWSRHNMESSGLDGIRWVVEDAMKFVKREAKRGNKYHGIILDPPAYGRGPDGEKWLLDQQINEMLKLCAEILEPEHHFFLLNMYSLSFSALIAKNLVDCSFKNINNAAYGELFLEDSFDKKLPLGIFY